MDVGALIDDLNACTNKDTCSGFWMFDNNSGGNRNKACFKDTSKGFNTSGNITSRDRNDGKSYIKISILSDNIKQRIIDILKVKTVADENYKTPILNNTVITKIIS